MVDPVKDLLDSKGITYKISGRDYLIKCLNPEHVDTNPSLRIDKSFGVGQCFACGFKVNIFKYFGIVTDVQSVRVLKVKDKIMSIFSNSNGLEIPKGATPFTKEFRGISGSVYKELGCFTHSDYDGRLVFPLRDVTGKIVLFLARHMHSEVKPKYKYYPERITPPLFPSKLKPVNGCLVLVEGIFDALNLMVNGIENVAAIHGANSLTNDKDKLLQLKLQGVTKVYIVFDGDSAGQKAAEQLKPILEASSFVAETIDLPEGSDPGSLTSDEVRMLKKLLV